MIHLASFPPALLPSFSSSLQVKTEEEADALLAVLENGADFGELAMIESDCPSRKQGGDLGWFGYVLPFPSLPPSIPPSLPLSPAFDSSTLNRKLVLALRLLGVSFFTLMCL